MIAPPPGLQRKRRVARAVLMFEQAWPAFWPALGVFGGWIAAAWLGLFVALPAIPHLVLLVAAAGLMAALLWRGARRIARPAAGAVDRRLEQAGGVRHRPLAVLTDRPSVGAADDPLWQAHLVRVQRELGRLRVGWPRPGLAARDPRALRALLLVLLAAGLGVAGADAPLRLLQSLRPGFVLPPPPPPLQIEAWVTPPAFTGQAPVALLPDHPAISVPTGARVDVSVSGGRGGVPHLAWNGADAAFRPLDAASFVASAELGRDGGLTITRDGQPVAHWQIAVVADAAPVVAWTQPPGATRVRRGSPSQARLPWQVSHPYGVVALNAELQLSARPGAAPVTIDIPLPGRAPRSAHGVRVADLMAHPWAGLPVVATLVAREAGGLVGRSATATFVLPERSFQHPTARAIIAVRKQLSVTPQQRDGAGRALERVAGDTATWENDSPGLLSLRGAQGILAHDASPGAIDAVQASLWELALRVEDGSAARTAQALAQARQQLRQALNPRAPDRKPDAAEIERRSRAVDRALQKHLDALAQEQRRDPSSHPGQDLDRAKQGAQSALQRLRDAARQDRMDDARDRLAELDQALDQLQREGSDGPTPQQRQRTQQRRAARQQGQRHMTALQDIVRRESGLLDHAQHRDAPTDDMPGSMGFPPGQTAPETADAAAAAAAERGTDRRVQQALRRALGELMQQFGDLTGKVPPKLGEADTAMRDAARALTEQQDAAAAAAAQRAVAALSQGQGSMNQTLAQQFGRSRGQGGDGADPGDGSGDGGDQQSANGQGDGSDQQAMGDGGQAGQDGSGQDSADGGDGTGDGNNGDGIGPNAGRRQFGTGLGEGGGQESQGSYAGQPGEQSDPFGRRLLDGHGRFYGDGDTAVPEKMDRARSRAVQDELRRREADRSRPQHELDYIGRLLNPDQ